MNLSHLYDSMTMTRATGVMLPATRVQVKKNTQMAFPELMKKAGLVESIASLACPDKNFHTRQCVTMQLAALKQGLSVQLSIGQLESLGPDIESRIRKDKQKSRVTNVLQNQVNYLDAIRKFESHKATFEMIQAESQEGNQEPDADTDTEMASAMVLFDQADRDRDQAGTEQSSWAQEKKVDLGDLYAIHPKGPFETLDMATVTDILARHLANHRASIQSVCQRLEGAVEQVASWKDGLGPSETLEAVLEKAASTLLKMDLRGNAFRTQVDALSKDRCC